MCRSGRWTARRILRRRGARGVRSRGDHGLLLAGRVTREEDRGGRVYGHRKGNPRRPGTPAARRDRGGACGLTGSADGARRSEERRVGKEWRYRWKPKE